MFQFLILSLIFFAGCSHLKENPCTEEKRALIDLGSGSVKMSTAEVRICPEAFTLLNYQSEAKSEPLKLEASKVDQAIPVSMQEELVRVLETFKQPDYQYKILATHALRTASNQQEVLKHLAHHGFIVQVLSQKEEAQLAYQASRLKKQNQCAEILVWDIGGGSQQLTWEQDFLGFPAGAEPFRLRLINKLGSKNPNSPNPIGKKNLNRALQVGQSFAEEFLQTTSDKLAKIESLKNCTIGVGGVHEKAVYKKLQSTPCPKTAGSYNQEQLLCLISELIDKDDSSPDLKGPYASTQVSNLFLVMGFMETLGIKEIQVDKVSLGESLLKSPTPWY